MCEISHLLGNNGVWVDHLTTLDPHPLNNDTFSELFYTDVDAPAKTYENVLFHDNYWQDINLFIYGEPVEGAYVRKLLDLSGGYVNELAAAHSDVHLWYHGTMSLFVPTDDRVHQITSAERQAWWTGEEQFGAGAGFYYSLLAGGDRTGTNRPAGSGTPSISDGYNQQWDFGAGTSQNRMLLAQNSFEWPNVIRMTLGTNTSVQGETNSVSAFIQSSKLSDDSHPDATLGFYLDDDFNPWNGNERLVKEVPLTKNPTFQIGFGSAVLELVPTNSTPGVHAIFAKISGGSRTRYLYNVELPTIFSSAQAPHLSIAGGNNTLPRIDVTGIPGQRVVLESSGELSHWEPLATNWLSPQTWSYFDIRSLESQRFYRGKLQ